MDTVLTVLAVVAVLVVLAVGWWLVRRRRTPSGAKAPPLLGPGWQFYDRPTELEAPGTVFRIDGSKRRYMVDSLDVQTQSGQEAVGRRKESIEANMGMVARFFGLGPKLDVAAEHTETFEFELKGGSRQYVDDSDLDPVLDPWLAQHELRGGSRYFVIREAVLGSEITYHLSVGQVDKLGGEASLSEAAKLEGNLHTSKSGSDFVLQQTFDKPMRVMFLPEELQPFRGATEDGVLRQPVTTPLVWEETADGEE
jgi:hypothetical protein